jgi:hypothetical protein
MGFRHPGESRDLGETRPSVIPAKAGIHEHGPLEIGTDGVHGFRPSPE